MKKLNLLWQKIKFNLKIVSISCLLIFPACQISNPLQQKNLLENTSKVITINSIKNVLKFANKDSLIVFDIDHTLLREYLQNKKNKNFYFNTSLYSLIKNYIINYNINKIINDKNLINNKKIQKQIKSLILPFTNFKMIQIWKKVEPKIKYDLTEKEIPNIVNTLHKKNIKTIAFTAREYELENSTLQELKSVNINLNKIPLYKGKILVKPNNLKYGYGYKKGVISLIRGKYFTEKTQKGRILLEFFKKINYKPNNIIFIDNRLDNTIDVFNALSSQHIKILGLFYKNTKYDKKRPLTQKEIELISTIAGNNWWKIDINLQKLNL